LVWQHHENPRSVAAYQTVILRTAPVNDRQGSAAWSPAVVPARRQPVQPL